jgi:hypothetical protein
LLVRKSQKLLTAEIAELFAEFAEKTLVHHRDKGHREIQEKKVFSVVSVPLW